MTDTTTTESRASTGSTGSTATQNAPTAPTTNAQMEGGRNKWSVEETRLFLSSLLAHLQCYPDSQRQTQIDFLLSVFPDRTGTAIQSKIDCEYRRWRKREHDPMPELTDLRHSLFRQPAFDGPVTVRRPSVVAVAAGAGAVEKQQLHPNQPHNSHSRLHILNEDDDGTSSDDIDHRDRKGMAEPWGESETKQFLNLLKDYQQQHPNQRRIDKIRYLVTHFPNRTDKAIAMKINHEKRRLLGSLRDPFPQLNSLRETVYKMNSADNNGHGGGGVRRIMDYREGGSAQAEATRIHRPHIAPQSAPSSAAPSTTAPSIAAQTFTAVTAASNTTIHDTTDMDLEQSVIRELKRIQEDLKRQRNETKVLTDYVSAIAQEVRQVRTQLHVINDK